VGQAHPRVASRRGSSGQESALRLEEQRAVDIDDINDANIQVSAKAMRERGRLRRSNFENLKNKRKNRIETRHFLYGRIRFARQLCVTRKMVAEGLTVYPDSIAGEPPAPMDFAAKVLI
jgi:hypothetical protein